MITSAQHRIQGDFESLYIQLREKEGRIYTDEEVAMLPETAEAHQHYYEWQLRGESCRKLISYLQKKQKILKILEVGCGNGWLSRQLTTVPGSKVIGTDINFTELQQAARVFHEVPDLHFIYGHIESGLFEEGQFDIIIFAASIQYFPSAGEIIRKSLKLLRPGGEIHIMDSHFYQWHELGAAKKRSLLYFEAAGLPEMRDWYFHHKLDDLEQYNCSVLYDPGSLFNRFLRNRTPFPWIRIQQ